MRDSKGDPISPYFFVIFLECLAHLIQIEVEGGRRKPIKASFGGVPPISHLFFADDLIFFAKALATQIEIVKYYLTKFSKAFGQKVNYAMSHIYFSPNITDEEAVSLSMVVGIPRTDNLDRYLGVPLLHQSVCKEIYVDLLD